MDSPARDRPFIGLGDKSVPWYANNLELQNDARELLEKYSHVGPDEVEKHILAIRDKIWEVFPYPCIGEFGFLDMNLCQRDAYQRIIETLRSSPSARHLDIGCCIGQDIRRMVYDGTSSEQIVGIELQEDYVEAGYELFRDHKTLQTRFVNADMLDADNLELNEMDGLFDTAHVGFVMHLFNRVKQIKFLSRVVRLLKQEPGVLIVGHALGHVDGIDVPGPFNHLMKRHNPATWEEMWTEISKQTGAAWNLKTSMDCLVGYGPRRSTWRDDSWRRLVFEVERK